MILMKNQSTFRRPTYMYAIRTPSPPEPKGEGTNSPEPVFVDLLRRPEVVCTVRLAIGFLLVLSKWCAQSRLAIGF